MEKAILRDPNQKPEERAQASKIERTSPEGRPAHAEAGPKEISVLLMLMIMGVIAFGATVAVALNPVVGIIMTGVGVLLFFVNPAIWASLFRSKERNEMRLQEEMRRERLRAARRRRGSARTPHKDVSDSGMQPRVIRRDLGRASVATS